MRLERREGGGPELTLDGEAGADPPVLPRGSSGKQRGPLKGPGIKEMGSG